jgi:hypothetical protein
MSMQLEKNPGILKPTKAKQMVKATTDTVRLSPQTTTITSIRHCPQNIVALQNLLIAIFETFCSFSSFSTANDARTVVKYLAKILTS